MIHKSSLVSDRRILTYPTVHPEATSPTTLLASMIDLAASIGSLKSQSSFSSNSRNNALQTFRNVSNILIFLEEVDLPETSNPSLLLSLSELHLALQKLRYLLADCTREGARLWMLMNSESVANQFRLLTCDMATSFDVFPMGSIHAPQEVKELVDLFVNQSRKAKFEVNRHAVDAVNSVLDKLRSGIVPEKDNLGQVLDYVGVRSWSQCNNEVKFLESEIVFESNFGDERNRNLCFLSGLMAFMCYCRCVFFNVVDDHRPIRSIVGNINPEDFRCPISLELMSDPVVTTTGHTYDRASIIRWFRSGSPICPNTGQRLTTKDLVPNIAVQRLIEKYCYENGIHFPNPRRNNINRDATKPVHETGSMKMVTKFLAEQLEEGSSGVNNRAAYEIRALAKTSIFNRSCLVESGAIIPRLLTLLGSEDGSAQENSIAALLSLSKDSFGKAAIVKNGGLRSIVNVLKNGVKVEAKEHAAATLFYLSSEKSIGEIPETVPALMKMVKEGTVRGQKNALVAIFGLLVHEANHRRVLLAGAVPLLIQFLKSYDNLVTDSLSVLSSLGERPEGARAILRVTGALEGVMEILRETRNEHCVALLLSLCVNGGKEAMCGLAQSFSLMESLYAVFGEAATSRTSKKASALIRILHEFYERRSCGSATKVLPQERFVHAR